MSAEQRFQDTTYGYQGIEHAERCNDFLICKQFVAYYHFTGWSQLSFGISIDLSLPNIELHIPTGFIRIGLVRRFIKSPILPDKTV